MTTTLTRSQLSWLSKMAKSGRLIVKPIGDVPEWARNEFYLGRALVKAAKAGKAA